MSLKLIAAAGLIAALTLSTARPAAPTAPAPTPAPVTPPRMLRVHTRAPADAQRLISAGYDVLETRIGMDLLVLGDDSALARLRAEGYAVTDPGPDTSRNAQTYYGGYRTVAEHEAHLAEAAAAHPDSARLFDFGDSWRTVNAIPNGHVLKALCLTHHAQSNCARTPDNSKPRLFVLASIHARELTPAEVAWRLIDYLIVNDGVNADVTWLLEYNEIWIVPLANPDGRSIVEQGGGSPYLQRKNAHTSATNCANPPTGGNHYGVDLNRNASFRWDDAVGTSDAPCDAVYRGAGPASESEEQAIEALLRSLFADQRGPALSDAAPLSTTGVFLTLHSFAELVLLPWGASACNYSACPPSLRAPNDAGLRALGFRMSYFNDYPTGQGPELLYGTSGTTDDFAYGDLGIPAYTFEIGPDFGNCGGFLPLYSCQQGLFDKNLNALLYAAKAARAPYQTSLGPTALSMAALTGTTASGVLISVTASFSDDALGNGVSRPAAQVIAAAGLYLDLPPWAGGTPIAMQPADGSADSSAEAYTGTLTIAGWPTGQRTIYARAQDAAGNWGPPSALFVDLAVPDAGAPGPIVQSVEFTPSMVTTGTVVSLTAVLTLSAGITPSAILSAELYIDVPPWAGGAPISLTVSDGVVDSAPEAFEGALGPGLSVGLHTLYVRGIDALGRAGPARAITLRVYPPGVRLTFLPLVHR